MNYSKTFFTVPVPEDRIACELEANTVPLPERTPEENVRYALAHPIGSPTLDRLVTPGEKVCVIIPDVTRRWQSPGVYVPIVIEALNQAGIPDRDITILSANGTHRKQSDEEKVSLVSQDIFDRIGVVDHVCTDKDSLVYLGTTSRGTPVWVNKLAMEADKVILTGGITYHFLAGFGGGRKYILPGISGHETIMKNHNLALNPGFGSGSNPEVRSANLSASNPFHMDMAEAAAMVKPAFLMNVVVNDSFQIISAFAGDYIKAHKEGCKLVDRMEGIHVTERTPLVIASAGGYPKDINLYQSSKTLCNALAVAEPGGAIILLSECTENFGDVECGKLITGFDNMDAREHYVRDNFSIGGFIGFMFAEAAEKHNLILVTSMDQSQFCKTKIKTAKTLDEALSFAYRLVGKDDLRVTLLPHGANTLPKF
jgi:nickel-dependent lactate racemase